MNNNVFNQPQQEPHNVFTHENNSHSFARRTISWFFTIGAIILFIGLATGWGWGFGMSNNAKDEPSAQSEISASAVPATETAPTEAPATGAVPAAATGGGGSWADSLSNFVKDLVNSFKSAIGVGASSIASGTESMASSAAGAMSGGGGQTVVQGQDDTIQALGEGDPLTEVTQVTEAAENPTIAAVEGTPKEAAAASQALLNSEVAEIVNNPEETLPPQYFEGKIVDYEGKPAGDIKAVIDNRGGGKSFVFTLDQSLTPADKPREFQVAYDEVEIIKEGESAYVKLNKQQTEAIAKALFSDEKPQATTE